MLDNDVLKKMAIKGAGAVGGIVVEGVHGVLKGEMVERQYAEENVQALDKVKEVCDEMVPDMAVKAVKKMFGDDVSGDLPAGVEEAEIIED